jgi:FKBP-type peptidyl-prolyl cis-trans isomerase 2
MVDDGTTVRVHYTGKLEDGTVFDSSEGRDPLTFEVGASQVIPGFEENVKALEIGESTTFTIEPEAAYGPHNPELVVDLAAAQAPDGLTAGDRVQLQDGRPATVVDVGEESVTIDANHPLAGKKLEFEVQLVATA